MHGGGGLSDGDRRRARFHNPMFRHDAGSMADVRRRLCDGRRFKCFRFADYDSDYRAGRYPIEPDASAASYFWAAAAITGGDVTVEGLSTHSLQGDVRFVECLEQMGCECRPAMPAYECPAAPRGIDVDMNAISDTVQTLAAVALFAAGPTTIRGVAHIRHKETDRIGDLARELRQVRRGHRGAAPTG